MQSLPLYQVDAFTNKLFGGNPAAVVPCPEFPSPKLMQQIAAENNLSETAFVVATGRRAFNIRWFTPNKEVRLCGHATLAAAHVLFAAAPKEVKELKFSTQKAGQLTVSRAKKGKYTLNFPADKARKGEVTKTLRRALGLDPLEVYEGTDDLLVVLSKESLVRNLAPNFEQLSRIKRRGVIVTAPGKKVDFVSRCFYPRYGILEDPVTGSAHTLLTPFWAKRLGKKRMKAEQVSERLGKLGCELKGKRVLLTGSAQTYLSGRIFPDTIQY